jgi:(1->4)-alpha-D-glucan 1-alpha-D-glucosylmutase
VTAAEGRPAPIATTYRVQVRPDFDLDATTDLVDYLRALGASHVYSAPLLTAAPGSAHGYDVVDPTRVSPQLGGEEALDRLVARLRERGMGLIVDIVPNHVGVAEPRANRAWWSLLRDGTESPYASWFDIDWCAGPILIPILGDDGLDDLRVDGDMLWYYEHAFPVAPGTEGGTPQEVHERQHYRLVNWRRGDSELTYRRFFAVATLAGVHVEDPDAFDATHTEILRWISGGLVDGLRVDHPDGLRDPAVYLRRLRSAAPQTWIVVEKILEYGESLPDAWPVQGTTGYDALREVCGVFIDPAAARRFAAEGPYHDAIIKGKRDAVGRLYGAELARLDRIAHETPELADVSGVPEALGEIAVQFPVYRSYLPGGRAHLDEALAHADLERAPAAALRALTPVLYNPDADLAQRFQQFSGAVMAKGVEDTAFYRWTRFIALNEVGGAPDRFGVDPADFHAVSMRRLREWPRTMTTLSTHDTKRGEDVRARLAVLAEIPDEWRAAFSSWRKLAPLDDPSFEALMWQTVAGAWPIERERLHAYFEKAAREASVGTSWTDPDVGYEAAMHAAVDAMYDNDELRKSIDAFVATIERAGWSNSLGQKLVQLTMPGVPDTYQGSELWDNSLVDPDNRRPVDFALRRRLLATIEAGDRPDVDASGAAKLHVTRAAMRLRRDRPELFGDYNPIAALGPAQAHIIAYDRGSVIAVATRLPVGLADRGGFGIEDRLPLPPGRWIDELTPNAYESEAPLGNLLAKYPVALLVKS